MEYVFRCLKVRDMEEQARTYFEENRDKIKTVKRGCIPIVIEYKDGKRFLFMTIEYYEKRYKIGRRKGIDYMTI